MEHQHNFNKISDYHSARKSWKPVSGTTYLWILPSESSEGERQGFFALFFMKKALGRLTLPF